MAGVRGRPGHFLPNPVLDPAAEDQDAVSPGKVATGDATVGRAEHVTEDPAFRHVQCRRQLLDRVDQVRVDRLGHQLGTRNGGLVRGKRAGLAGLGLINHGENPFENSP